MKAIELNGTGPSINGLPTAYETVIAITRQFQCLAYVSHDGQWHSYYGRELLNDVVTWESLVPAFQRSSHRLNEDATNPLS